MIKCAVCDDSVKDNRWAKIRAHSAGWLFLKNGVAYCPLHIPDDLRDWRESKR